MDKQERIQWIDLVRTIAIILVVGFHILYELNPSNSLRPIGFIGVSLFFIVSGFLLAKKYPKIINFDFSWLWKRYISVASTYYLALIAIALLFGTQAYLRGFYDLFIHFIFLNFISHDTAYSIISPSWFVIPLIGLYIAFPFLNGLMKKYKWFIVIAVLLSLISRLLENSFVSFSPVFFLVEFCFGIGFAQQKDSKWLIASLLVAIVNPLMVIPFIFFWVCSLLEKINLPNLFSTIGKRTFEIFLFHEAVVKVIEGAWNIYGLGIGPSLVILALFIVIVIKLSEIIRNYFEDSRRPSINS